MASKTLLFLWFFLFSSLQHCCLAQQGSVKAAYWNPSTGFAASNIDSTLFTHLFCAFADLNSQTNQVTISSNTAPFSEFTRTVQLKNPSVKTLLSIGGGYAASSNFASMSSQPSSRKTLIDSSINLARSYGFHGLDLDWENQSEVSEMADMGKLLEEWRAAVEAEPRGPGVPPLILTAAVSYMPQVNSVNYPTESIARNLDWINVMAYDFYAPKRSDVTRSHAALYDPSSQVSASYGIRAWTQAGLPSKKMVLGLPFYGYAWHLVNPTNHYFLAPASGVDDSIESVDSEGAIGYRQIREFKTKNSAQTEFNATIVSDYCYSGTTWIGFDDSQTISTKVSYAKQNGLLGYFAWQVGADNNWVLSQQALKAWGS